MCLISGEKMSAYFEQGHLLGKTEALLLIRYENKFCQPGKF